jgi:hypothetical protein
VLHLLKKVLRLRGELEGGIIGPNPTSLSPEAIRK